MTNEEAIQYAKDIHFCTGCPIDMSIDGGESCKVCEHRAFFEMAIDALEKQRYIDAKIDWLKTLNQFEMILVSDVLDWFEDAKVEDD